VHCLTGDGTHFERWDWTLAVAGSGSAVQLYRDGHLKITLPLTPSELEALMDGPLTLFGMLKDGL
jgi:hypothetical protein